MQPRDCTAESVEAFDRTASLYAEKYFALKDYDRFYEQLLVFLPQHGAFIDVACGPGNASAYVSRHRSDVHITGVDLAPNMIREARTRVPGAKFFVGDCRELDKIDTYFDAAAFCFGLSYLDDVGAQRFFAGIHSRLKTNGGLLLSTITAAQSFERVETCSTGDKMLVFYRTVERICQLLERHAFEVLAVEVLESPANASQPTRDLIALARKR